MAATTSTASNATYEQNTSKVVYEIRWAKAEEGELLANTVRIESQAPKLYKWLSSVVASFEARYLNPLDPEKVLVAVDIATGKAVAFVHYSCNIEDFEWGTCGEIKNLFVIKRCQGRRIGDQLLGRALRDIEQQQSIKTTEALPAAIKFYENHRFQRHRAAEEGCFIMVRRKTY